MFSAHVYFVYTQIKAKQHKMWVSSDGVDLCCGGTSNITNIYINMLLPRHVRVAKNKQTARCWRVKYAFLENDKLHTIRFVMKVTRRRSFRGFFIMLYAIEVCTFRDQ